METLEFIHINDIEPENWLYDLLELKELDKQDPEFGREQCFEGDPDTIKTPNSTTQFIDIEPEHPNNPDGKRYIISEQTLEETETGMLNAYFNNEDWEFNDGKEVQNWNSFWNSNFAVAYRGGKGYVYDIAIFD